ncbi:GNAT family N-acetyltransferase [Streptomyces sp. RFCAC02]|uniref:GNAT family N-acetyltransferase n=1 Tax=Streptomyces sp. RFCAC02 TaxID=2499143 RepID=UPI0019D01C64|nr:GNAT family N-acetyltransferase [Streptomyces sp. RFCAC02]
MTTTASPDALPLDPEALPIRRLSLADHTACLDLAESRGWGRKDRKWRLLLAAGRGYGIDAPAGDPVGGLVATVVATSCAGTLGAISMVLTAERYGRRGLASRLLRHVIAEAAGTPLFLSATQEALPLYRRFGFAEAGASDTFRGHFTGSRPAPAAEASGVRPATAADLPGVLALDRTAFGADRTDLLARLPSFADQFLVAEDGGALTGFAAAWPQPASTVLGPVIARDPATAQALISRLAAGAPAGVPLRTDVDRRHPELADWLAANGLVPHGTSTLMTLGIRDLPGDITRRFAPLSSAVG